MRRRILAPALAAAALIGGALGWAPGYSVLDGLAEDAGAAIRALIRDPAPQDPAVVVVTLDERSLAHPRLADIPRPLMSPVWDALAGRALDAGAVAVGFDFLLAYDAARLRLGEDRPLARYDDAFLRRLRADGRAGRVVIGRSQALAPARRFALTAGPAGVAHVDIALDPAGVARRAPGRFTLAEGGAAASLSGALIAAAGGAAPAEIPITAPWPLTALPTVAVIDALECGDPAALVAAFAGKVVLVGGALPAEDVFTAPDRFMARPALAPPAAPCELFQRPAAGAAGPTPGVYLHAAAVDAVLSGWAPRPAPGWVNAALAGLGAAVAALAALTLSPGAAALAALGVAVGAVALGALGQEAGWLIAAARPGHAAALALVLGAGGRILFLDRRARAMRASFGKYLAPELVDRLIRQDRPPALDGEQRDVSVMFADLSGFTALSETVDGKTLTATVNRYLEIVTQEVDRTGGYVDKYIGDAVMAIWNAPADLPDHAARAVDAAWAIVAAVARAGAEDAARGLPNFSIKVGLNAGPAIVGNVGAKNRLNYTAVGDTVNLAARLESLPGVFGAPIVLGPASAAAGAAAFDMLEIGSIRVKGKRAPVALFTPLSPAGRAPQAASAAYAAALAAYRAQDFAAAIAGWDALARADWPGATLSARMRGFAEAAAAGAPHADWSGVIEMTSK